MQKSTKKSYDKSLEELSLMQVYLTRQWGIDNRFKFLELSGKGHDFKTLNQLMQAGMVEQLQGCVASDDYIYLTELGRQKAKDLLSVYGLSDKPLSEQFEFRTIRQQEAHQAVYIENACFPPNEACSEKAIKERIKVASDLFLVAIDIATGKIAGFLNGIATDEYVFRDEFFKDASLHKEGGINIMLLGLDVLPAYRKQGLAHEIVYQYLRREYQRNRKMVALTCSKEKVKFYENMGFVDHGLANSNWGGEVWHEMIYTIHRG